VAAGEQKRLGPTAPATGEGETILVVEDEAELRAFTVEVLSELGYRVLEAETAAGAMKLVERENRIDVLFTDVVLPGGTDGRALAEAAMRLRPAMRVLFTTGYTRNAIVHHGRLDPGVQMIGKPFTYAELASKVREVIEAPAG
jgi:CheY-like chemotaxis protein